MEYGSIEREFHVEASPEVVFEVISNPEHIREWWNADRPNPSPEPAVSSSGVMRPRPEHMSSR